MPRGSLDAAETEAGRLVANEPGGVAIPRDVPGAPDGTDDVDVEIDGRVIRLEVTSGADPAIIALWKAALEPVRKVASLGHHWWLLLPSDGNLKVNALMAAVVPHLEVLERHQVPQVATRERRPKHPDAANAAREIFVLRIDRATQLDSPTRGDTARVMATTHGGVGSDFDSMNALVEACAARKVAKLAAAGGDERHRSSSGSRPALRAPSLRARYVAPARRHPDDPARDRRRPGSANGSPGTHGGKLLRLRPPGGWERVR